MSDHQDLHFVMDKQIPGLFSLQVTLVKQQFSPSHCIITEAQG